MTNAIAKKWHEWFDQSWETNERQRDYIEELETKIESLLYAGDALMEIKDGLEKDNLGFRERIIVLSRRAHKAEDLAKKFEGRYEKSMLKQVEQKKEIDKIRSQLNKAEKSIMLSKKRADWKLVPAENTKLGSIRKVPKSDQRKRSDDMRRAREGMIRRDSQMVQSLSRMILSGEEVDQRRIDFNEKLNNGLNYILSREPSSIAEKEYIELLEYIRLHQNQNKRIIIKDLYNDTERTFTVEDKRALFKTQDKRCKVCGEKMKWEEARSDHKIPHSLGGDTDYSNIRILCKDHDSIKANSLIDDENLLKLSKVIDELRDSNPLLLANNLHIAN